MQTEESFKTFYMLSFVRIVSINHLKCLVNEKLNKMNEHIVLIK